MPSCKKAYMLEHKCGRSNYVGNYAKLKLKMQQTH